MKKAHSALLPDVVKVILLLWSIFQGLYTVLGNNYYE